jgi:hypothetical protein
MISRISFNMLLKVILSYCILYRSVVTSFSVNIRPVQLRQQVQSTASSSSSSSSQLYMATKPKVFIDGEAGTTGIQVRDLLAKRDDLEIISAPTELRKDETTRKSLINEADVVILCKLTIVLNYFIYFRLNFRIVPEKNMYLYE